MSLHCTCRTVCVNVLKGKVLPEGGIVVLALEGGHVEGVQQVVLAAYRLLCLVIHQLQHMTQVLNLAKLCGVLGTMNGKGVSEGIATALAFAQEDKLARSKVFSSSICFVVLCPCA